MATVLSAACRACDYRWPAIEYGYLFGAGTGRFPDLRVALLPALPHRRCLAPGRGRRVVEAVARDERAKRLRLHAFR
jgi:hypothetical protein